MAQFYESIRNTLSEFDKFLEALKNEKLSKKLQSNRDKVTELLKKLREEYPALSPTTTNDKDESDGSAGKVSTLSGGVADEDDYAYTENVPDVAVKDLTNPVKMGFLEKKRKKATLLQSAYQKRFCVIHNKTFYYYEKSKDAKQAGAFFLEGYEFREAPQHVKETAKKELSFEIVGSGKRSYQFLAESKEEFQAWRSIIENGGEPTGDIPIEGEFDDIYEDMDDVAEQVKSLSTTNDVPQTNGNADQEVYDDAESTTKQEEVIGEMDEVYDDVGNVEKTPTTPEKPTEKPPPVPPPMRSLNKPSMPLPDLPPPPPSSKQDQPLPALPDLPPPRPTKPIPRPKLELSVNPLEDYENMYYGKWDWKADSDEELSFKHGEIIHVVNREFDNKDWWVGRIDEKYGLVPKHYLIRAYRAI
ncbi:src kinase-associated phosphoprotein 2-like [Haliotis asinina]|uniref:src kinase-associated phosphoprotein 2-like n=1 Tax=Haliotis asinina TaxID=109174 RepID=UPI003531DFC6